MSEYNINLDKRYRMPEEIQVINYNDKILVIAPQFANWIVLESPSQLSVFNYFKQGHSIQETISNINFNIESINYVVTQLEAKKFCNKEVHSSTDDERSMHLYLTNKCNLACPHCYMFSGKPNANELTTEEILKLIAEYREIVKGTRITLSGGEPTSHVDFDLIVKTAAEIGLEVKILTNGTQMNPERIDKLSKYIQSVQISIDGFSEETNSPIRGRGSFSKALEAVDSFVKHGIETSIAVTPPFEILQNHIEDYISFAKNLAAKYTGKPLLIKFAEGLSSGREINPTKEFNEEYANLIKRIQKQIYDDDYDLITFVETMSNDVIMDNCMFGVFSIASNGDVYFCPDIGELSPIANIRTSSIKDIFKKSLIAEKATLISKLKPCNECELRYICGGGCRTKEFPELVNRTSFENINYDSIPIRSCNSKIKERFYNLMIQSNEYLYTSLDEE